MQRMVTLDTLRDLYEHGHKLSANCECLNFRFWPFRDARLLLVE